MHGQTSIGVLKARVDVPPLGQTADGKYRVFMNFLPRKANVRTMGTYKYWKRQIGSSEYEMRVWSRYDHMHSKWEEVGIRKLDLSFSQALQWGIESAADEFDCNVWMEVRTEYLDPTDPSARAMYYNIHVFGLDEVKDLNRFVQAFASRINREAKYWSRQSVDWSIECI